MSNSSELIIGFLCLLFIYYSNGVFTPNILDYNAYGLRLAMNELFLVQVQNNNYLPRFLIQFAPYNDTYSSSQCTIILPNATDHYIYTVAIGKNQTDFFFAGELINGKNGTFVGVAKYNSTSSSCATSFTFVTQYFKNYEHQEYYIIDVRPRDHLTYGFSNSFILMFDSLNTSIVNVWNGNQTWPHTSFMPHAVDLSDNYGIIAGFIRNPVNATSIYIPMIYLINFNASNHPFVADLYEPNATASTWQDLLSNSDADMYSAKYDMSVSINQYGNILVGMQFINRVFLFSVNRSNPNKLVYVSRNTNGRSLGNGKGIAWLDNGIAVVLINTYTLNYQWISSQIYFYDIQTNGYNSNSTPLSVFPNNHQITPLSFSSVFLNIISSPSSLALLDDQGNILILNPTPRGYFPAVQDTGSMPIFTSPRACLPGSYKNQTGVHDCILCPTGTKNSGNSSVQCIPCLPESFCPLGSVNDVPQSILQRTIQVIPYPKPPESIIFDEILIQNMFHIGPGHCLLVSPLFWTILVASLGILMIIFMAILKICINDSRSSTIRRRLKCIFKHTDLIGEGELWIGGLASFCVIVLVSFAYSFSSQYLKQYPIETVSDSHFACDASLRNAKFQTNVQSLSIPVTEAERNMFDLLNNQSFYLNVDLVNTLIGCDVISLQALFGTTWSSIRWLTCNNANSILSLSIPLPYQHITVQILLATTQTIGALRVGLSAHGHESERYNLKELNFYEPFSKYGQILAQNLPIELDITKVINETAAMLTEDSDFGGVYISTFTVDINSLFLSQDQYIRSTSISTTLTISLRETPYYVKNLQQPIAKRSEIIFHNLLFTTVCLELFGLGFLLYKLIIKPCYNLFLPQNSSENHKKKLSNDIEANHMNCAF